MHPGREQIEHARAIACCLRSALEQRPPEEQGRNEKARVLQNMHRFASQCGIEPARNVPEPKRKRADDPGDERAREPAYCALQSELATKIRCWLSPPGRQRPDERSQRMTEDQQRGRED